MKKVSTAVSKGTKNFPEQKLTIGLDLGDRSSWYCVLDEAGEVLLEERVSTTPKVMAINANFQLSFCFGSEGAAQAAQHSAEIAGIRLPDETQMALCNRFSARALLWWAGPLCESRATGWR